MGKGKHHRGFRPLIGTIAALDQYKDTRDQRLQVQYVYFKFYDKSYDLSPAAGAHYPERPSTLYP